MTYMGNLKEWHIVFESGDTETVFAHELEETPTSLRFEKHSEENQSISSLVVFPLFGIRKYYRVYTP